MKYKQINIVIACFFIGLFPVALLAQAKTVDGYKGIWFTLNQFTEYGDKYSGGLGTYTSSHIPLAVYSKEADKTFFVYGGTTAANEKHLLIMLSYYDHKRKVVPKPVVVYDKVGVDDPHDNASINIDPQGHIWIFVSGRNTSRPGFIFKGVDPYSIEKFEQVKTGDMTYPQPWWVNGKGFLYLFTKYTKGRELYFTSSPDGMQWPAEQKLAGMGGHYQISNQHNGRVVSVFNYHPGGDVNKRTNVYLAQTSDMGQTWTTVDGKPLQLPLSDIHSSALIKDYESEGKLVYLNDVNFDKNGNPVILAVVSRHYAPGPKGDPREWVLMHWKGDHWQYTTAMNSTHNYDMGSLYIDGDNWMIVGPTEAGPQKWGTGGEMALWQSSDEGLTWKKKKNLTTNSKRNHAYARRPLSANNDFIAFWADGDADSFSESHLYFSNKKGQVYALPYNMSADVVKPKRLKK